jgi:hypothetical protein
MKRWQTIALLVLGGTFLGATVFSGPIATAAQTISATITDPVDGQGNVKVHEQGTANVNVTNGSLNVASPTPITDGGNAVTGGGLFNYSSPVTASALSIHMSDTVDFVSFTLTGNGFQQAALFYGPGNGGNASIVLALDRPIKFNRITCVGADTTAVCSVSWAGTSP